MRSSFITLTFAVVCLLGSSLTSPVYDKRVLGSIGQAAGEVVGETGEAAGGAAGGALEVVGQTVSEVGSGTGGEAGEALEGVGQTVSEVGSGTGEAAGEALEGVGQALGSIVGRSVPGDDNSGHLNKRRRILKKILRGARRFSGSRSPRPRM
ncbi:hypothetical protein RMCBS344292_16815 [Rhizopus microsporus]|nr:hypothetical protein RMCBS344292_11653 [Rhizopus microsporus]CEJ02821.1 hypothetical protein RMCBS344292_16815 [Rhizopus microsporus]